VNFILYQTTEFNTNFKGVIVVLCLARDLEQATIP
jgi:hypothetical protein